MPSFAAEAADIAAQYIPAHTGRPSTITHDEKVAKFIDAIRRGHYYNTAADLSGLSRKVVYDWLRRADAGESAFVEFRDTVKRAEAEAVDEEIQNVRRAGKLPHLWAASMTYLERRHPEDWGKRSEASNAPQVLVQVGIQSSDVSVSVQAIPQVNQTSVIGHEQEANALPVIDLAPTPKQLRGAKVRGETRKKKRRKTQKAPRQLGAQTPAKGPTGQPGAIGGAGETVGKS